MDIDTSDPGYQKALVRVKKVKGFYEMLATFILVNIILIGINLITSPDSLWFYWVTFIWGIWLIWYAFQVFVIADHSQDWEEKKIQKYMEKDRKKQE